MVSHKDSTLYPYQISQRRRQTDRVNLPALHVGFQLNLDLLQVLQLRLVLAGEGLRVPGVLHDSIHRDALLHISFKDAIQKVATLI